MSPISEFENYGSLPGDNLEEEWVEQEYFVPYYQLHAKLEDCVLLHPDYPRPGEVVVTTESSHNAEELKVLVNMTGQSSHRA